MKTFISALVLLLVLLVAVTVSQRAAVMAAPAHEASVTGCMEISGPVTVETSVTAPVNESNFFAEHWGALLMGLLSFYDLIARLTPTTKDNSIVSFLTKLFNVIVPNARKGGGTF